ncbi:serine hydrolase [Actinophytocola sp.]|uniref:serine hydrolase n=1 Tax=Actinophytocola sp. TaxID=1872138 RepID=UPI0039C89BB0
MDPAKLSEGLGSSALPGGQLAVLHHGAVRLIEVGEEEHRGNVALTGESRIPVGSITKTFTTTLAASPISGGDCVRNAPDAEYLADQRRCSPRGRPAGRVRGPPLVRISMWLPADRIPRSTRRSPSPSRLIAGDCYRRAAPVVTIK